MVISLSNRRGRQFVAGMAAVVFIYFSLASQEFLATVFASDAELPSLKRAVFLSPGNADYRYRLGRYYAFVAGDPQSSIESLRAAVYLNPHNASYWFDLAGAYQVIGYIDGQRAALDRALEVEPTAPAVAWQAANFFLIDGQTDRALQEFHVVVENDIELANAALLASWRVRPDTEALLKEVVPARPDSLQAFLDLLRSKQQTDGTIQTWRRLADLHQKFPNQYLYEQVRYLIEMHRPEAAMAAWEQTADVLGLSAYLPTEDNLIVNGDFSLDILNGGFDWTYTNRTGVKPLLDPTQFREGHRSLSLSFLGPGINDAGIEQIVPVHGAATYDFSAFYKSSDFEGAGGPQIVLRDAYTGAQLWTSEPLRDADFWKEVHTKVTTASTTNLLVLAIERFPAGSPIRGKLWLDDFELSPDDSHETSSDTSSATPPGAPSVTTPENSSPKR